MASASIGAGRFAPSPTGDLHLGGARTALVAWLEARQRGARFVVRVEDLDPPRVQPGAEARLLDDLRALGLDWDEGPDLGGPHAPYRQGERGARYEAALSSLARAGRVFRCYCSRAEVARAGSAPHAGEEGPRYPGTCRDLDDGAAAARQRGGRSPSWRFRVEPGEVAFRDAVFGPTRADPFVESGDFVVKRADGLWAYQLAVVVDDAAMAIDRVVRGADLLSSTARQLLLYRALGAAAPSFAHLPLVMGQDGARLAKRHGAITIRALLERGAPPRRIVGALAASLGLCPAGEEAAPRDLVGALDLARLPRTETRVDPERWP